MKRIIHHLMCALVLSASAFAQDTLVFKNGDVLTGKILSTDADLILFDSGLLGSVNLNTNDIAEMHREIPKGRSATAPLPTPTLTPLPENVNIPAEADTKEKPPSQWSGQAGLAVALREKTYSNTAGVYREENYSIYRLDGNVKWKGEKNALKWSWIYRYSADEIRVRDDYFNVTQKYNHSFKSGYYVEAKTVYQRDENRNIDNEYLQTAEIGKKWFQHPKFQFSTSLGGAYHQYDRLDVSTGLPKFIFDGSLRWNLLNSLTLFQTYTHLGDLDQYRLIFSSGLENKLIKDIFIRLEYRLDRDTDTAYNDRGYYDKALLTKLIYKF